MKLFEKTISSKEVFKGRIIDVTLDEVELENGKKSSREVVGHPGGVCIAALTKENELLFVRQFRYPYREVVLELPRASWNLGRIRWKTANGSFWKRRAPLDTAMFRSDSFTRRRATARKLFIFISAG